MRVLRTMLIAALLAATATACDSGGGTHKTSVFLIKPGQCFIAPGKVKAQLSTLTRTPCSKPHTEEAYAVVAYAAPGASVTVSKGAGISLGSSYPGDDVLTTFAQGACAQRYGPYVGVDYLDSSLFFTYLLPSARSWQQQDDHDVICFVTTTGAKLTSSVKGSKL